MYDASHCRKDKVMLTFPFLDAALDVYAAVRLFQEFQSLSTLLDSPPDLLTSPTCRVVLSPDPEQSDPEVESSSILTETKPKKPLEQKLSPQTRNIHNHFIEKQLGIGEICKETGLKDIRVVWHLLKSMKCMGSFGDPEKEAELLKVSSSRYHSKYRLTLMSEQVYLSVPDSSLKKKMTTEHGDELRILKGSLDSSNGISL
jgi:hypothetical protein